MKYVYTIIIIGVLLIVPLAHSEVLIKGVDTQLPVVGKQFELKLEASGSGGATLFEDNTGIFDISQDGTISFIPRESDIGKHTVNIKVTEGDSVSERPIDFIIDRESTFELSQRVLSISLKHGTSDKRPVRIKNTGTNSINLVVDTGKLAGYVADVGPIKIDSGSEATADLVFNSDKIGVSSGKLIFYGGGKKVDVPVVISVTSGETSHTGTINIPSIFNEVGPGKELTMNVIVINIAKKTEEVELEYEIRDLNNNVLASKKESITVADRLEKAVNLEVPAYVTPDQYVASLTVRGGESTSISSKFFIVSGKTQSGNLGILDFASSNLLYILVTIIVVIIIVLYLNYGRIVNIERKETEDMVRVYEKMVKKKQSMEDLTKAKAKLTKQLRSLDEAYKSKLVTEESYNKGSKRIEKLLKDIERKLNKE